MRLWSGGQGVPWILKGFKFKSAPHQISTARDHRNFHILSGNGFPFFLNLYIYIHIMNLNLNFFIFLNV